MNKLLSATLFALLIFACAIAPLSGRAADSKDKTDDERMQSWWDDLEKADPEASRALLNFADKPELTVAFFKTHLLPLKISEEDVKKLIEELGSDDEAVWKPAYEKLEYFDPRLTIDLETLVNTVTDQQPRNRLIEILSNRPQSYLNGKTVTLRKHSGGDFNFVEGKSSWWAEPKVSRLGTGSGAGDKKKWTRATRAIVLLQHIGSAEAIEILKDMTTGHPDAGPTRVAHEALDALGVSPQ